MKLDKVLVPLDGSTLAEAALPVALHLMKDNPTATLSLLRAADAPIRIADDPIEEQVRVVREAESYLAAVTVRLTEHGAKDVKTSVWYGSAAPAIVEAARIGKVDLIVMSTHGRTGLARLVLGSVAESVLRSTHTPILLVRDGAAPLEEPVGGKAGPAAKGDSRV